MQIAFNEIKEARFCFSEECINNFIRRLFTSAFALIMSVILFLIAWLYIIKLLEIDVYSDNMC
jgi:hypothetical protein